MSRADLYEDMLSALTDTVLKRVENCLKGLRSDASAVAPEHILGYEAGFRAAKFAMIELLSEVS
jgi:hypothetical protein